MEKPKESKRIVIKDLGTSGLAQNLNIVSFVGKYSEEKDKKYDRYAARREERNLRTKALERYIFGISEEGNLKPRVSMPIIFTDEDLAIVKLLHADPLVIKQRIGDAIVSRVLIDGGSISDEIIWSALRRIGVVEELIQLVSTNIYAFEGAKVNPIGTITLPVYATDRILTVNLFMVDTQSMVKAIMGWEWIHSIKGVVLTLHQLLRCESPDETYTIDIRGDPMRDHRCFNLDTQGRVKRLSAKKLYRMEKGKAKVREQISRMLTNSN